jgi:hypothetical protein
MDSLAVPVAEPSPARTGAAPAIHLRAGERELRAAVLAVAYSASRLKTDELRARYARAARILTATEEGTAAATSGLAELLPNHAERLRALSAAAEETAREWRRAAGGEGHGGGTTVDPGAAGPAPAGATSMAAMRLKSEALAQRLEQARASARETIAQIRQGRPQREVLSHSVMARLRARLDTMPVIEQAKGIIIAQSHCRPDEAFDLLRRASQRLNVPVRELAAQIVANTARAPGKPREGGGKPRSAPAAPGKPGRGGGKPRSAPAAPARPPRLRTIAMPASDRPDRVPAATPD